MKGQRLRRRGLMLVVVVIAMTLVGGLLVMLAASAAERYRHRQAQHVRLVARAIADSAADYARMHLDGWRQSPPEAAVELDIATLLPPGMSGRATITVLTADGQKTCHISTQVARGIYAADEQCDIPVNQGSRATAPAATSRAGTDEQGASR